MRNHAMARTWAYGRADLLELAWSQESVVSRRQLLALGVTRWQLLAELAAHRWRAHGRQTIAVHTGELTGRASYWYAIFEAGPRAAIDGASALVLAGLTGFTVDRIRVSVPRAAPAVRRPDLLVRQTRRLRADDVVPVGVPRVRTPIAAVRGALWAASERQATTLLAMSVQQRITPAEEVALALVDIRRHKRLRLLHAIMGDLLDGAHSLGELDFADLSRQHGLPVPDRLAIRKGSDGRFYLDVWWDRYRVVVEIDGIQHSWVQASIPDALRQNRVSIEGETVLRIPVLGLRVAADVFLAQVAEALRIGGWHPRRQLPCVISIEGGSPRSL